MAIFSPFAGRLSDKIEPRVVASIGMGFTVAGLFLFTFMDRDTHLGFILTGLVLLGFGFALFSSPNTNAVMSSIEKRFYGVGSATLGTMRLTGQMLSMGIAMVIFSLSIGSARITPEYYPQFLLSMKTAFHDLFRPLFRRHLRVAGERKGEVTDGPKEISETCRADRRGTLPARWARPLAEAAETAAGPTLSSPTARLPRRS